MVPPTPEQHVSQILNGYQGTCVVIAGARIGLFAALARGPKDVAILAAETKMDGRSLERLLRSLVSLELCNQQGDRFALTSAGHLLATEDSAFAGIATLVAEQYLPAWSHLEHSLRTAEPAFDHLFQMSAWEHRRQNPHLNSAFGRMIERPPVEHIAAILDAYPFPAGGHMIDVGGGRGWLLAGILQRYPSATATLFDQPHVVDGATATLEDAGVTDRCQRLGGSFFDKVPSSGDVYLLQSILHDWPDAECQRILSNCHQAMSSESRLVVLERVLPSPGERTPVPLAMLDIHMMAVLGGAERTLADYDALLEGAGFRRLRMTPTPGFAPDVIEARIAM